MMELIYEKQDSAVKPKCFFNSVCKCMSTNSVLDQSGWIVELLDVQWASFCLWLKMP